MRPMIRRAIPVLAACAALAFTLACNGGGDDDPTPVTSPTSAATAAASPTAGATPSGEIRSLDIAASPDVKQLMTDTGGTLAQENVVYGDLTGDGIEEAIAPIASGGTMGYVAFAVLTPVGTSTKTLLKETPPGGRGFQVSIEEDHLVITEPVPGPDDPECCPSMLRKTIYAWNGAALAVDDVQTVPNPAGGVKTPSVSP